MKIIKSVLLKKIKRTRLLQSANQKNSVRDFWIERVETCFVLLSSDYFTCVFISRI